MNKTEFINAVAAKGEMDKKAAEKAVNAVIAATTDALKNGEKIQPCLLNQRFIFRKLSV